MDSRRALRRAAIISASGIRSFIRRDPVVALEAEHVLGLDNYYFYIRGFMKSFDGLAWPIRPGHPDYPVQMAVFGAIYLGIATTVHMAIVLLAAQIAPLAAARTAPEYDPANSGVGPRCCGAWLIWATRR